MSAYQKRPSRTLVEKLVEATGLKKSVFARRIGIVPATFSRYLSGERAMPDDLALKFVEVCRDNKVETTVEELRAMNGYPRPAGRPKSNLSEPSPLVAIGTPFLTDLGRLVNVPVYRYIAAGPLTDEALVEEDEPMTVVEADARFRFFLVSGRSMEPDIEAGDTLKVDEHRAPKEGLTAIVQIDEGSTVGILRYKGRKLIRIEKAAPGFRDILIKPGMTVQIKGVVDEIIRRKKVQPAPR